MMVDEINIKLVVLGFGGVGKTSIVNACMKKGIPERYIPTIGSNINKVDYSLKEKKIVIRVNMWDVGGQRSFNPLNPAFYNNVDAAFLVFDLSDPEETIEEVKKVYLKNLYEYTEGCLTMVVGNKLDQITNRKDIKTIIEDQFTEDVPLVVMSAKSGENVLDTLELLVFKFLQEWEKKYPDEKFKGISGDFMSLVGKKRKELEDLFINLKNLDSLALQKTSTPHVTSKYIKELEEQDDNLKQYIEIRNQLKKIDVIKGEIIANFNENLSEIQKLIVSLKNTPINQLIPTIETTQEQLNHIKNDFEVNLDSLLNLEDRAAKESGSDKLENPLLGE